MSSYWLWPPVCNRAIRSANKKPKVFSFGFFYDSDSVLSNRFPYLLSSFHMQNRCLSVQRSQNQIYHDSDSKQNSPMEIQIKSAFMKKIAHDIQKSERCYNAKHARVFSLQDRSKRKRQVRGLPASEVRQKCRCCLGPCQIVIAEFLA